MHEYIGSKGKQKDSKKRDGRGESSQQKVIIFYDWEKNEYTVMSSDVYQQMDGMCVCNVLCVQEYGEKANIFFSACDSLYRARLFNVNTLQCTHERAARQRRKGGKALLF